MILIIGSVPVRPDMRDRFLAEVRKAVRASSAEEGVSRYELVESIEEPNKFTLIEEYADETALTAHSQSDHMAALGAMLGEVLEGPPDVTRFDVSSAKLLTP